MKPNSSLIFFLFGLFLFCFCPLAEAESLVVPGTGDSQALLRRLAAAYNGQSENQVHIPESVGSSGGIQQLLHDKAILVRVARPLTASEKELGLQWKQFAYAPVVFACHPGCSDITSLTGEQINGIFSGRYQDWSEIGGREGPIYVAQREVGDSSRTILGQHFPIFYNSSKLIGKTLYSTPEMVDALSRYRNTVGYLPTSAIEGPGVRPLQFEGVSPTEANLKSGRYPLSLPLALVWKGELSGPAADFVEFLSSEIAGSLMMKFGVVPVKGH